MDASTTWSLLANVATTLGTVGVALAGFWQFIKRSQREQVVPLINQVVDAKLKPLGNRIDKLEQFSAEFKVIQTELSHVLKKSDELSGDLSELGRKVDRHYENLTNQITGAIQRVSKANQ